MPRRKAKDPERAADLPQDWIARHLQRVEALLLYDSIDLTVWRYRRARLVAPGEYADLDQAWKTIHVGETWGGRDVTAFFQTELTVPSGHAGPDTYLDIFLDGGETQLRVDGRPWQGLDWYRSLVPLGEYAQAERTLTLDLEAFVINYPYDERRCDERSERRFARARLVKLDRDLEAFLADARFVLDAYLSYWRSDDEREIEDFLRHHLEEACRLLGPGFGSRAEARAAAQRARSLLRERIFASGAFRRPGRINLSANSHLDIVYLWPLKETLRKNCRTATNMLSLLREFPAFRFTQSQPYLYEQLKAMHPDVYAEIQERVREGRWEVVGAMYVEPDGNLPGAESLVRQLLFGQRFYREEFGRISETCWLPDVFGIMYTLPQVLRQAGVRYLSTVKLNVWNDTNDFPYDTFRWRGPDGSEVIAHFPPTHFGQDFTVDNLRRQWRDFRDRDVTGENLFLYGWCDGGGGPTREMAAASQRADGFPGLTDAKIDLVEPFFRRIEAQADKLPVWDDELYLEAHRGTYTTKGELKRLNRQGELLYRDAEILSSLASLFGGPRVQEELNRGWKLLLLNQFHDTLPGTHRGLNTSDIHADYAEAFAIGRAARNCAIAYLAERLAQTPAAGGDLLLFNTLSWTRDALLNVSLHENATATQLDDGPPQPVQHYAERTWLRAPSLPSLGWRTTAWTDAPVDAPPTAQVERNAIETARYRIELDDAGRLVSVLDKVHAYNALAGPGNDFQLFEDDPGEKFSAWDIAYHVEEYRHPVRQIAPWTLATNGPLFAVFTSRWQALESTIEQEMWLYAHDPRIDFKTRVDWRCRRKLLKVAFPLNIRTRCAVYDLPFGHIERATHRNTSWEQAKFEVCGHKWADLSQGDYGVALLNDGKYGYDARENLLRLSLLRSPIRPDPESDRGVHEFTYALLPHAGDWRHAQIDRCAYELNAPALAAPIPTDAADRAAAVPPTFSLLEIESRSLIVEALKQAETGDGLILRAFDSHGYRSRVPFVFGLDLDGVMETNLLEEEVGGVALVDARRLAISLAPYEIKTHQLHFA